MTCRNDHLDVVDITNYGKTTVHQVYECTFKVQFTADHGCEIAQVPAAGYIRHAVEQHVGSVGTLAPQLTKLYALWTFDIIPYTTQPDPDAWEKVVEVVDSHCLARPVSVPV